MSVATSDGRTLAVRRNGFAAIAIGDQRDPHHNVNVDRAQRLADALESGANARIPTREGSVLVLQGERLGIESAWHTRPDVLNPQAGQRPYGPWALSDESRQELAAALRAAAGR